MKLYFVTILFIWINQETPVRTRQSAVGFLTVTPNSEVMSFAQALAQNASEYDLDVYIVIDEKSTNVTSIRNDSDVLILDVSTPDCFQRGYRKTMSLGAPIHEVTSWDKALFYFAVSNRNYSFVWLIEDDVFIPSTRAFLAIHSLYAETSDVLIARNGLNRLGNTNIWLFGMAWGLFLPPWSCSMANVVGLSRRALDKIDEFVRWRGRVPFHEFFFNTLAIHENLTMRSPLALSTINYADPYTFGDVMRKSNNLWHPMKDFLIRELWRKSLSNESSSRWNPVNLTNLVSLCHHQHVKPAENSSEEEKYLKRIVGRFDQMKTFYARHRRISIQRQVMSIFEQCQQLNTSVKLLSLLLELADHAYRRPDVFEKELIKEKSPEHRRLEDALRRNKEMVLELVARKYGNSSLVQDLRADALNWTILLSLEIHREEREETRRANESRYMTTTSTSKPILINRSGPSAQQREKSNYQNNDAALGNYLKEKQLYPSSSLQIQWIEWSILILVSFLFLIFICRRSRFSMQSPMSHASLPK